LIVGGLSLLFVLDELFIIFILRTAFPRVVSPLLFRIVVGAAGIFSFFLAWVVFRALRRRPSTGSDGLIGERGKALSAIDRSGDVFVHGEIWKAISEEEIQAGDAIEVTRVDGLALKVRKVPP
jgi:membrane-bound serine protease (ClpP class)